VGTFSVTIEIGDRQGRNWKDVEALADTGATYTWVARDVLERLGVIPEFRFEFETADGRVIERDVAQTSVRLDGTRRITLIVFGDRGSRAVLGAYTLEGAGLSVDPVNRRLARVRGLAMPADLTHSQPRSDLTTRCSDRYTSSVLDILRGPLAQVVRAHP
jgi:predicted aspartyl protease